MKRTLVTSRILGCLLAFGPGIATPQSPSGPSLTTAASLDQERNAGIRFGFDDLMSMLVQPRHLKLFYAGSKKNWELAAAEARNLRAGLSRVEQAFPTYLNIGVAEATTNIVEPNLQALDAAIAAADAKRFAAAFGGLTAACNACHAYMERPYISIKVPDATTPPDFSDQEFGPLP